MYNNDFYLDREDSRYAIAGSLMNVYRDFGEFDLNEACGRLGMDANELDMEDRAVILQYAGMEMGF